MPPNEERGDRHHDGQRYGSEEKQDDSSPVGVHEVVESAQVRHIVGLGVLLLLTASPAQAGIDFTGCTSGPDGSITCNTVPTGNTLTDDIDARYGLDSEASPGWSEYEPYQGFDDE